MLAEIIRDVHDRSRHTYGEGPVDVEHVLDC